ncbi:general stress protein [Paenibacillus swuensis]|uniref:General stress protein n=1 Tax=Paenibacillus swuensis TaxID=1178515 RepID=A0A172TMW0_9BACL|nr:Dps family protein [Paenibacillus swuensis]ANE48103.1 general stress protein [Paenibacillus swuensis]
MATNKSPKTTTQTLEEALNLQVANFSVLYMKLHHYHWFVTGPTFFSLHPKFEEMYNEITLHLDALAERMLGQGYKPASRLKDVLSISSIKEAEGGESAEEMVTQLVADYTQVCTELDEAITMAEEEEEDQATADLLTQFKQAIEKHVYMLNNFLGKKR